MNLAHYFTFLRIALIPFFPFIYLHPDWFGIKLPLMPYILLLILIICEITDFLDGYIARRQNLVSDIGKIIDPMADTITHISVMFTFTQGLVSVPLLIVFVLLYRELAISALRTICALKGYALAARKSGKIKAVLQATVCFIIILLMIPYSLNLLSLETLQLTSMILVSVVALYTLLTMIDYFYANRKYLKKLLKG